VTDKDPHLDVRTISALILWAVVGMASLVLAGRAMSGAFDESVHMSVPILATAVALAMSLGAWALFYGHERSADSGRRLFDGLLVLAPPTLVGFATSVQSAPATLGIVVAILVLGLAFVVARESVAIVSTSEPRTVSTDDDAGQPEPGGESILAATPQDGGAREPLAEEFPVQQQMTRRSLTGGGEQIEVVLLAGFQPHERQTAVHLPIQPPLRRAPEVECEPLDESNVTIRPTAVYSYGVRIEVKRSGPVDAAATVPIGLLLSSAESAESAA